MSTHRCAELAEARDQHPVAGAQAVGQRRFPAAGAGGREDERRAGVVLKTGFRPARHSSVSCGNFGRAMVLHRHDHGAQHAVGHVGGTGDEETIAAGHGGASLTGCIKPDEVQGRVQGRMRAVDGEAAAQRLHSRGHARDHRLVVGGFQHVGDPGAPPGAASASPKPRVVIAGEPMRMPLVTKGFSGSFGIAFLLTVMCARPSTASATLPVIFLARRSTRNTWLSVPPGHDAQAALGQHLRHRARIVHHLLLVAAEGGRHGLLERHGLGRDHVHERSALDAGEDGGVERPSRAPVPTG